MIVDSNVAIRAVRRPELLERLVGLAEQLFVPPAVRAELLLGCELAQDPLVERESVDLFLDECVFVPVTKETAAVYAKIACRLRRAGTPIPQNDIWIAASALEHDLPLLTNDAHFDRVDGLRLVSF